MKINEIIIKEEEISARAVQTYAASLYQAGRSREAVLTLQVASDPKFNNSIDTIQGEVALRISQMGEYKPADKKEFDQARMQYKTAFGGARKRKPTSVQKPDVIDTPRQRGAQMGNQNAFKGSNKGKTFTDLAKSTFEPYSIDTRTLGTAMTSGYQVGKGIAKRQFGYTPRLK